MVPPGSGEAPLTTLKKKVMQFWVSREVVDLQTTAWNNFKLLTKI
jgi:hypothetical protein